MSRPRLAAIVLAIACGAAGAIATGAAPPQQISRFERPRSPIALIGPARPGRYLEAAGRRAAFLGDEDGHFEAWAYPIKLLHDFRLSFRIPAYAEPIPAASLAADVIAEPEGVTVRFAHAAFTVDAIWIVPRESPGGTVLLDVHTSVPLTVIVSFRPDLKPMWPAALGGQYSYWSEPDHAFVLGEASRAHGALVGSPLAVTPPEQPAHNLPDTPLRFEIPVTPASASQGLIPIAMTGRKADLDLVRADYRMLLTGAEQAWRESSEHYRQVREDLVRVVTPDARLDRAVAWAKVAIDRGFVCNPDLGCGLVAGLGPSGTSERPGFGWFFGGDAAMNSWAMAAAGDTGLVRDTLDFFFKYQRADGKLPHEISQGAGYLRWFEDYPYPYYHADTTPILLVAVADYVRQTDDRAFLAAHWPAIRRAFEYCASTDEDGDGLMDNSKAGLAAVETGTLRSSDVRTDVYLASVWVEAARGMTSLAHLAHDEQLAGRAEVAYERAARALHTRFAGDDVQRIPFARRVDGSVQDAPTAWPAVGLWRGAFAADAPQTKATLDLLAGSSLRADWGARMLADDSASYDPLSYNNGAVWPFVTGFVAMALYAENRPDAGWGYVDGLAALPFLESRGYVPELLSGDRLRSLDAAVPHQLFSSSGLLNAVLRGVLGFDRTESGGSDEELWLQPSLPAGWDHAEVRNLRWRGRRLSATWHLDAGRVVTKLEAPDGVVRLHVRLHLPPGSDPAVLAFDGEVLGERRLVQSAASGITVRARQDPLVLGDESTRLRVIDAGVSKDRYVLQVEGRRDRAYLLDLDIPFEIRSIDGAIDRSGPAAGRHRVLEFRATEGKDAWGSGTITIDLGHRLPD